MKCFLGYSIHKQTFFLFLWSWRFLNIKPFLQHCYVQYNGVTLMRMWDNITNEVVTNVSTFSNLNLVVALISSNFYLRFFCKNRTSQVIIRKVPKALESVSWMNYTQREWGYHSVTQLFLINSDSYLSKSCTLVERKCPHLQHFFQSWGGRSMAELFLVIDTFSCGVLKFLFCIRKLGRIS